MTILANTYQTTGTSQAVTVPYQPGAFLGIIFVQFAGGSFFTVVPWGLPSQSSGAGGGAGVWAKAFDYPADPADTELSVTVNVGSGPMLVIAMSISKDDDPAHFYNMSAHDVTTVDNWTGALVPATATVQEAHAADYILGFVAGFMDHTTAGTATVTPGGTLVEVAEVSSSSTAWVIEVCSPSSITGSDQTVTVSGTPSGGTQRIDGFSGTWYIDATVAAARGRWSLDTFLNF